MNGARPECGQRGGVWTTAECSVLTLQVLLSAGNLAMNLTSFIALSLWGPFSSARKVLQSKHRTSLTWENSKRNAFWTEIQSAK